MRAANFIARLRTRLTSPLGRETLLIFVVTFISLLPLRSLLLFTIFQERDLVRARQVASGHAIFFGPELSGGGHLPGAFYYYISALPIWLGFDWEGAWVLNLLFAAAAFAMAWWGFRKYLSLEAAFAGCISLICLPQFVKTFVYFQNFSLLPFFLVVALFGFAAAFAFETRSPRAGWIGACVALGLGLQLHMSTSFVLAAGLALQVFAAPLGLRRLPWRDFAIGIAALGAIVAPYYIWLIASEHGMAFGQIAPQYVGTSHFNLDSFQQTTAFTPDREGMVQLWKRLVINKWGDEVSLLISMPAAAISLFLGFAWAGDGRSTPSKGDAAAFRVWLICAVFCIPPVITIVFTPHRARYFTCAVIASIFAFTGWFEMMRRRRGRITGEMMIVLSLIAVSVTAAIRLSQLRFFSLENYWYWTVAALIVCIAGVFAWSHKSVQSYVAIAVILFAGLYSHHARYRDVYFRDSGPRLSTLEAASKTIAEETGWSWNELRERLFLVNFHYQRSMATVYRQTVAARRATAATAKEMPDGYLLALKFKGSAKDFRNWLIERGLPPILARGLKSGDIQMGELIPVPGGTLTSYRVTEKLKYPGHFQNVGINYLEFGSDRVWHPDDRAHNVTRVAPDHARFAFNDCPDLNSFCTVNIDVKRGPANRLQIEVAGDVISQPSVYISPNWSQSLYRLYLSAKCGANTVPVEVPLIDQIGIIFDTIKTRHLHTIVLAPAERLIENPCPGKIRSLSVGYKLSKMSISRALGKSLPGRELTLEDF